MGDLDSEVDALDDVFIGFLDGFVDVDEEGYDARWVHVKPRQTCFLGSLDRFIEFEVGRGEGVFDTCVPRAGTARARASLGCPGVPSVCPPLDLLEVFACAPESPPRTVAGDVTLLELFVVLSPDGGLVDCARA